jgi:hypothetical protein
VVVTLFYVGLQVKHSKEATEANTRSLEEGRKIALADAYHARAVETSANLRLQAESWIAALAVNYRNTGAESLTEEERFRVDSFLLGNVYRLDASFHAFQQGLLPEYESTHETSVGIYGPMWHDFGVHIPRESFRAQVDRIMANRRQGSCCR